MTRFSRWWRNLLRRAGIVGMVLGGLLGYWVSRRLGIVLIAGLGGMLTGLVLALVASVEAAPGESHYEPGVAVERARHESDPSNRPHG